MVHRESYGYGSPHVEDQPPKAQAKGVIPAKLRRIDTIAEWLIAPRTRKSFGWAEAIVLVLYCAVLLSAIPFHEPWGDEAQAWLLARDCPLGRIFFYQLHYEGTPGLWHLVLWAANRLHFPFISMHYISGAFATAAVYVLLRYAPLPRLFRLLLPFTFYFQFQYAVVARNYAFFAVSVFVLVWLYTRERPAPVWFAVVAGLTANESMHGALFAAGLFVAYVLEQRQRRKRRVAQVSSPRRLWLAAAILGLCGAFAFWTAFPAPDNYYPLNSDSVVAKPGALKLRARITGIPVPPALEHPSAPGLQASVVKGPAPVGPRRALQAKMQLADALLTYPISTSFTVAYLFLLSAAVFIVLYAGVRGLLPYLFLFPPMVFIHSYDHHAGLLFITLIAGLWMAWQAKADAKRQVRWVDAPLFILFAIVVLMQIVWTFSAIRTDHRLPYDGGEATARFLKDNAAGKTIVSVDFMTTAIQPYFAHSIFANRPNAFLDVVSPGTGARVAGPNHLVKPRYAGPGSYPARTAGTE